MKYFKRIRKTVLTTGLFAAALFIGGTVYAAVAPGSVRYQGVDTPALPEPSLNAFYDVPSVGNEADFIRVKKDAEPNAQYRNVVDAQCKTGDKFDVWFYVHNAASEDGNNGGNGPSIAKNVKARVDLDNDAEAKSFSLKGFLTSSNAGNIDDDATINCGNKKFKLTYVEGSANAFLDLPNTTVNLPNSIVTTGTPIGTMGLDGNVWGCWDQRVWMGLTVVVEEIQEPVLVPAVCDALEAVLETGRKVKVNNVVYTANDATVNDIELDFGDGNKKTVSANKAELPYTHTYGRNGTYTVRATLNTIFKGQTEKITSDSCAKTFTVNENPVPAYSCENFVLTIVDRKANVSFKPVYSNGATFKDSTINFNADGSLRNTVTTNAVNSEGKIVSSYTYATNDKNVEVIATVRFNVPENGGMVVKEDTCKDAKVLGTTTTTTPPRAANPTAPTTLPKTGIGASVAGLMGATTVAGTALHRRFTLRRNK
jgi:hypothetical protein